MSTNRSNFLADKIGYDWFVYGPSNPIHVYSHHTAASYHDIFKQVGYVGPRIKSYPPPIHGFTQYYDRIHANEDFMWTYANGTVILGTGPCLDTNAHSIEFEDGLDFSLTYQMALDKLNDKTRGDLDLAVDIAEIGQTKRMFNATQRVEDFTKVFSRKFALVKTLANLRLEYMYGVKPLLSSVFGCANELIRFTLRRSQLFKARSTIRISGGKRVRINTMYGPMLFTPDNLNLKMSTELGCYLQVPGFDLQRFSSLNPVSIAWELMPYSFVADWFLNVGGYLRNLETGLLMGKRFLSGYRSDLAGFSGDGKYHFPADPGTSGYDTLSYDFKCYRFDRYPVLTYPLPDYPSFQANLGSSRLLNGAALLAQFLGKR